VIEAIAVESRSRPPVAIRGGYHPSNSNDLIVFSVEAAPA